MSERQLQRLVERWRRRLAPEWRLDEVKVGIPDDQDQESNACCWRSNDYERASIYFNRGYVESAKHSDIEQTVVHEVLHLTTRELIETARRPLVALGSEASSLGRIALEHDEEKLVDRLAHALVELAPS